MFTRLLSEFKLFDCAQGYVNDFICFYEQNYIDDAFVECASDDQKKKLQVFKLVAAGLKNTQLKKGEMHILAAQCSVSFRIQGKSAQWIYVVAVNENIISINRQLRNRLIVDYLSADQ